MTVVRDGEGRGEWGLLFRGCSFHFTDEKASKIDGGYDAIML